MFRWAESEPKATVVKPPSPPPPPDPRVAMMRWFSTYHLHESLIDVVSQFSRVACWMMASIPAGPEATVAMRKLIEAKDGAVRATIEGYEDKKDPAEEASAGSTHATAT